MGGTAQFVKPGEKIVLKPNVLLGGNPDACVTTHPAVFKAVGELFQQAGARIYYGDSSSIGKCEGNMRRAQLKQVGDEMGFIIADFDAGRNVSHPEAILVKSFNIANGVLDNDGLVSLPKLKAHGLTRMTGAVKNQFGCIPGIMKGEYHIKLPDANKFAQMLVDLSNFVKPALYVMDGIQAMEGNGPRGGKPRHMGLLLFSSDPIALDATVCRLINLDPENVPTIKFGSRSGSGFYRENEIELVGDEFAEFKTNDFAIDRAPLRPFRPNGLLRFINNRLVPKPHIMPEKCVACGECITICPTIPKSVDWFNGDRKGPPTHDYKSCIRCYCCQEICPESAIELKVPAMRKVFRF